MATRTERISDILRAVRASSPEVVGACVVNREGFIVASHIPTEVDEDVVGGMAASILGVGERIAQDMMNAQMEQVYVRSSKGFIIVNSIDEEHAVVLLVTREAKLGVVFLELKKMSAELAKQV